MSTIERLRKSIPIYNNFPVQNNIHYDIYPLLTNTELRKVLFDSIKEKLSQYLTSVDKDINLIIGLETEGFLIGTVLADQLKIPFLPIRRRHKLPGDVIMQQIQLNGKTVEMEIQSDYVDSDCKALIVDNTLGDGTFIKAAENLVQKAGGTVVAKLVITEKTSLKGRLKFDDPEAIISIVKYN